MSTDYQLLPDPTTARVTGSQYTVTVRAWPIDVVLDPANLPQPVYTATVTGNNTDDNTIGVERARAAIEQAHQAAQREAAELQALMARLAAFARPVPVTVQDAS